MKKKDIVKYTKNELIDLLLKQDEENILLKNKVKDQSEQISILNRFIYAKKNEKWTKEDKTHSRKFNEAEDTASEKDDLKKGKEGRSDKSSSHKRGRKPLPKDIPRNTVETDLSDDKKGCPCCGKPRPYIGMTPSEKLEFKLAEMTVTKYMNKRYGACDCEEFQSRDDLPQVLEAKTPDQFIPGSVASPSLVAYIITSKFVDALPLYRQERIFQRIGVNISRQNMSNWSLTISKRCEIITEHIRKTLISGKLINMDETTVQVLNERGRSAANKSYMWVMTGGETGKKAVLFNYSPTRNQEIPMTLLKGYKNTLQTDGYAAYNKAVREYGLWHVGCLTHARRKFYIISQATQKKGKAHKGVEFFTRLYAVESSLKKENLTPDEYLKKRRKIAIPIWKEFHKWLVKIKSKVGDGKLSDAVGYSLNQYQNLVRYLRYSNVTPDNNIAENAIRPFCVGRKNWLFNSSPRGAFSSAVFYSLVETAKINNVEPYHYLVYLFSNLQNITAETDLDAFMPWNMPKKGL